MKRYRIRPYSLVWWGEKLLKSAGALVLLAVVEWGVIIAMLALYAEKRGLPMPWEGVL